MGQLRAGGRKQASIEWPTIGLIGVCYGAWFAALALFANTGLWPALAVTVLCVTLFLSLQHEALHGHPTRNVLANELLVFPGLSLFIPYRRFRSLHLRHHRDAFLTDPYEDPESFYLPPGLWRALKWPVQKILIANNSLVGRLLLGPAIAITRFVWSESMLVLAGDRTVQKAWALHLVGVALVAAVLHAIGISLFLYALAICYPAMSLIMLRSFAEHRAHENLGHRTIIVEKGGLFSFLFLYNNLHVVHHKYPSLAWYRLPATFRAERDLFLRENGGYYFKSYWQMFRQYALHPKEPVAHPLLPVK